MLKIGDFSRLAQITIKTLRHYDRLGLLKPVWIDRYTGYRYYDLEQLPRLNRIVALKEMGFSLVQIRNLLEGNLSFDQLRLFFNQKQQELQHRLSAEQARLNRVAEILQQIEQEGSLPAYEVTLKQVPPLMVASQRAEISSDDQFGEYFQQARQRIELWVRTAGLRGRDQWLILHHNLAYRKHNLDVEVVQVLEQAGKARHVPGSPLVMVRWLPAVDRMASLLYCKSDRSKQSTYTDLNRWIERNGYFIAGPAREVILRDPERDLNVSSFVEVQYPIENAQEVKQKLFDNPYRKDEEMEPKIISRPAFTVVGVRYYGKNEHQEISQLWAEFNKRSEEIRYVSDEPAAFGICQCYPETDQSGEFEYVAGFRVDRAGELPTNMVSRDIPAHTYAVFTHIGALEKLSDTYQYIYQVWMPQSGYKAVGGLDFEYYNGDFKDFAPDSRFYIYVPIE
jgi:predicted transcriptional regulator YdeE/DNA-binding transcriptional MerR regulator